MDWSTFHKRKECSQKGIGMDVRRSEGNSMFPDRKKCRRWGWCRLLETRAPKDRESEECHKFHEEHVFVPVSEGQV
jgi:hypothetical protein